MFNFFFQCLKIFTLHDEKHDERLLQIDFGDNYYVESLDKSQ